MSSKSLFGLNEKFAAALSYAGGFITGILFYVLEKDNKFVKFHALQSTILFGVLSLVSFVVGLIPIFGGMLTSVVGLVTLLSWVYLMYTAYKGQSFKVPFIGDAVWEVVNK